MVCSLTLKTAAEMLLVPHLVVFMHMPMSNKILSNGELKIFKVKICDWI